MELENPGSALGTMYHARRGVKRGHDVPALQLLQGRDVVRRRSANSSRLVRGRSLSAARSRNRFTGATRGGRQGDQIWIDFQDRSLAEHNRTFNHVLELAHVSRPLVGTEMLHRLRRHGTDRKSTRLNSSHSQISYAVFCLKKKNFQR